MGSSVVAGIYTKPAIKLSTHALRHKNRAFYNIIVLISAVKTRFIIPLINLWFNVFLISPTVFLFFMTSSLTLNYSHAIVRLENIG